MVRRRRVAGQRGQGAAGPLVTSPRIVANPDVNGAPGATVKAVAAPRVSPVSGMGPISPASGPVLLVVLSLTLSVW